MLTFLTRMASMGSGTVGWIGFGNGLAGNFASVISGLVMDRQCLRRRLKLVSVDFLVLEFRFARVKV